LAIAQGKIRVRAGRTLRLQLKKSRDVFGLLIVDAFGSDAIPVHLLTREALAVYLEPARPNGVLAFHISNRYIESRTGTRQSRGRHEKPPSLPWFAGTSQMMTKKSWVSWIRMARDGEASRGCDFFGKSVLASRDAKAGAARVDG